MSTEALVYEKKSILQFDINAINLFLAIKSVVLNLPSQIGDGLKSVLFTGEGSLLSSIGSGLKDAFSFGNSQSTAPSSPVKSTGKPSSKNSNSLQKEVINRGMMQNTNSQVSQSSSNNSPMAQTSQARSQAFSEQIERQRRQALVKSSNSGKPSQM